MLQHCWTFQIVHMSIDLRPWQSPILGHWICFVATWRLRSWQNMMVCILGVAPNCLKTKLNKVLGDLGFEPRSQCSHASAPTTQPNCFIRYQNSKQIIYSKQLIKPCKKMRYDSNEPMDASHVFVFFNEDWFIYLRILFCN